MPKRITNIHDKFVKDLLSTPELAIAFLEEYLPIEVVNILDFGSLTYQNTSYLSKELKASYSDMVWSITSKEDISLKICLLLEHKSYVEPNVNFQLLEYLALAYQKQLKEKKELELIIPILYYHGSEKWEYQSLQSHFTKFPIYLQKYLPNFAIEFINLQQLSQQQIQSLKHGLLRTALTVQRYYTDSEQLNKSIEQVLLNLNPYLESNFIDVIFVYLIQNDKLNKASFKKKLEILPPEINSKAMSIYDELLQEGIEKGKAEGIVEGIEKGIEKAILNSYNNGIALETIRLITGESIEKIMDVLKKNDKI